jgi:hypothetical protein
MIKRLLPIIAFALFSTGVFAEKPIKPITGSFPFTVLVPIDSTNISQVKIFLGSAAGQVDLINGYSFLYGISNGLPAGYSYAKRLNTLSLTIGTYTAGVPLWGSYQVIARDGTTVLLTKKFMYK